MKLKTRLTHNAIEIKVDEVETYFFKDSLETQETIDNLISVIEDICQLTNKEFYFQFLDK